MTLHATDSERALLGYVMCVEQRTAYAEVAALIEAGDWYHEAHGLMWQAIVALVQRQQIPDPVFVLEELRARGNEERVGGAVYIHTVFMQACPAVAVPHHAQAVADAGTRRRLVVAGKRIAQRAEEGVAEATELVAWSSDQLAAARDERKGVEVLTSGWEEFIHSTPDEREMVIPGLLGLGDRLILTGHGGLGKSTLLQQIAVSAAAGLRPFDWHCEDPYTPARVTILDFENPDHRVKTRLWPMVQECVKQGADPRPNLTIGGGGNPLNMLNPQAALSLLRTIEHDKPTLVYVGPVYKMHNDDPDKESVVKKITDVLDSIRAMGIAIITEAHHTKEGRKGGTLEPSGSNLWTWWPEFGLGLRMDPDPQNVTRRCVLERWRIDRESSEWPDEIEASGKIGLPWARASFRGVRGVA